MEMGSWHKSHQFFSTFRFGTQNKSCCYCTIDIRSNSFYMCKNQACWRKSLWRIECSWWLRLRTPGSSDGTMNMCFRLCKSQQHIRRRLNCWSTWDSWAVWCRVCILEWVWLLDQENNHCYRRDKLPTSCKRGSRPSHQHSVYNL